MKISASLLMLGLSACPIPVLAQEVPAIDGYVTRVASQTDFDANGFHVGCGTNTVSITLDSSTTGLLNHGCPTDRVFVGEPIKVYGSAHKKNREVAASRIEFSLPQYGSVEGSSVVEGVQPIAGAPGEFLVRSDGYQVRITSKTNASMDEPLRAITDIRAGDWIAYKGRQSATGEVEATSAKLARLAVKKGEQKLRAKNEFDPAAVKESDKQSSVGVAFFGIDPKRFPPYKDPEMQARVDNIGKRLIPAFERDLPDSDPTKINIRFQLIDTKWFRDALTLPNGIILVPRQVVERLQNDSQIAAVLADNIACALERQTFRAIPANRALAAGEIGTDVAGFIFPEAFLLSPILGAGGASIQVRAEEQSGRVSLDLLSDAGFEIDQAPLAWWLLSSKKPQPISETQIPHRASYLYQKLGETWHNPATANRSKF